VIALQATNLHTYRTDMLGMSSFYPDGQKVTAAAAWPDAIE
jgi:hypothetical protein